MNIEEIREELSCNTPVTNRDELLNNIILPSHSVPSSSKIFLSIMRTSQLVEEQISKFISQFDLTLAQLNVLEMLYFSDQENLTQEIISKMMFTSKANISTLLSRMESRGLIRRDENSQNKRQKIVSLLEDGKKVLYNVYNAVENISEEEREILDSKETQNILESLLKIREKLGGNKSE